MEMSDHEVVDVFKKNLYPLSNNLVEMLNEHYSHQTERRGCGYTQATRVLADFINVPRQANELTDLKIFQEYPVKNIKKILDMKAAYHLDLEDWHNLDLNEKITLFLSEQPQQNDFVENLRQQYEFHKNLRQIQYDLQREESQILTQMLIDILLPKTFEQTGLTPIQTLNDKPKVGSCPMAENFFLKIAHGSVLRQGSINIIVDENDKPLFIEKLNMGDNHSCISLTTTLMNGVRVPAGALFALNYNIDEIADKRPNKQFKGFVIPYTALNGFWFLRLTTLAISPQNRKRAFTTHFQQQIANGLFSPESTQLDQLREIAQAQI